MRAKWTTAGIWFACAAGLVLPAVAADAAPKPAAATAAVSSTPVTPSAKGTAFAAGPHKKKGHKKKRHHRHRHRRHHVSVSQAARLPTVYSRLGTVRKGSVSTAHVVSPNRR
jgi:hypothetical protein